jgi:hypothetical protein
MIEQQLGAPLPYYKEEDEDFIPEEYEVQISRLVAQASAQLLQQNQAQAAQQQAQQQAQDPIIQMQQQEVQIKAEDLKRKAKKDADDFAIKQAQLEVERERIMSHQETAGAQMAIKVHESRQKIEHSGEAEGARMGMDMHKHHTNLQHQRENAFNQAEHQRKLEEMRQNVQQKLAESSAQPKPKPQKGE